MTETGRGCFFQASNCSQNQNSVLDAMTTVASQYFLCELRQDIHNTLLVTATCRVDSFSGFNLVMFAVVVVVVVIVVVVVDVVVVVAAVVVVVVCSRKG